MWNKIIEFFQKKMGKKISIFEHIQAHINPDGPGLLPGGDVLPDEEEYTFWGDMRWAPGALDVIAGRPEVGLGEEFKKRIDSYVTALRNVCKKPSGRNIDELEKILAQPDPLAVMDDVLRVIVTDKTINQSILYQVCRGLFFRSRYRGAVKFATAIMGLFGVPADLELFKIIGRHEEFSLNAAVAVMSCPGDVADAWLEMAKNVAGWGRIHLVSRLVDIDRDDVRDFLLREGCRNDILPEYTALGIAKAVKLSEVLKSSGIDRQQFESAGLILSTLVTASGEGAPYKGIEDYPDSFTAAREYLKHANKMASSLQDYLNVHAVKTATVSEEQAGCRESLNWTPEMFDEIEKTAGEILEEEKWKDKVLNAVESDDTGEQWNAIIIANIRNYPIEEKLIRLLEKEPEKSSLWYILMQRVDEDSIDRILKLAEKKLDIESVATGPALEMGLGKEWEIHKCLDFIVQDLGRFPGKGWNIIQIALKSPVIRNRNMAIKALNFWDASIITDEMTESIKELLDDPDEMVGIGAGNLLRKWGVRIEK